MKKVNLINKELTKDINLILKDKFEVDSGSVGGFSIEVIENDPTSFSSYVYYNEVDRDSDLKTIEELLENN